MKKLSRPDANSVENSGDFHSNFFEENCSLSGWSTGKFKNKKGGYYFVHHLNLD